jgi:hypothetical protein
MLQLKASLTLPDYGVALSPSELWLINLLLSKSSFRVHSSCFLFFIFFKILKYFIFFFKLFLIITC